MERSLAAERQARVRDLVRKRRVMRVEDLCSALAVSAPTVRRDLAALERQGGLRRVHGGVVSEDSLLDEPLFDDKAALAVREKRAIAEAAATLIGDGETVYLDGGSTLLELARLLREKSDLTVVTNSLRAAVELSGHGPRLILIGGELRRRSQTMVGPLTRLVLGQLNIDRAFLGSIGVTVEDGLTTTDPSEAFTKELVIGRAREVVLLADSSKLGQVSFARAGGLDQVHHLITDRGIPASFAARVRRMGVRLTRV